MPSALESTRNIAPHFIMRKVLPICLLPLWALGVPLVRGIVALVRMPKGATHGHGDRMPYGAAATPDLAHR